MSESPELTTRDVLQQVDRRLSHIEGDVRALQQTVESRSQTASERADRLDTKVDRLDAKVDSNDNRLEAKIDRNFRWTVGLIMASWFSVMTTLLLK